MEWIISFAVVVPFVLALVVAVSDRRSAIDRQARRLAAVERKLDLIMDHLDVREPEPTLPGPVWEELVAGRKIQAIKKYREATGAGLKEAKDAVELVARQRGLE
ncbi:ribosomal protein L7/L12 [Mangrovihabitans endophyticus]|nr:ribosomal protein L7/L12 [Mangrovihabitans endophyticus]